MYYPHISYLMAVTYNLILNSLLVAKLTSSSLCLKCPHCVKSTPCFCHSLGCCVESIRCMQGLICLNFSGVLILCHLSAETNFPVLLLSKIFGSDCSSSNPNIEFVAVGLFCYLHAVVPLLSQKPEQCYYLFP